MTLNQYVSSLHAAERNAQRPRGRGDSGRAADINWMIARREKALNELVQRKVEGLRPSRAK